MKTSHILIILAICISIAMGIYVISLHYPLIPIRYTNLDLMGIENTYSSDQTIKFQVKATGYGMPCSAPDIVIYRSDQPSTIVFEKKNPPFMCPIEGPVFFNIVYPSQNDAYSIIISQADKYTVRVSFFDKEIEKQFTIIKSQVGKQNNTASILSLQCENEFKPKSFEQTVLPNGTSLTTNYVPVFLMKPNSTGKICINNWRTFHGMNYSGNVTAGISKDSSITQDITVKAYPDTVTIDDTNKTIVYTITASKDATGFYRFSPMFSNCGGMPLAIGYDSTHSFDNDFPWLWDTPPCPFSGTNTEITGLTGINVAYITKEYR